MLKTYQFKTQCKL